MSNNHAKDQSKFDQTNINSQNNPKLENDHERITWTKSENKNIYHSNKVRIIDNLNRKYY